MTLYEPLRAKTTSGSGPGVPVYSRFIRSAPLPVYSPVADLRSGKISRGGKVVDCTAPVDGVNDAVALVPISSVDGSRSGGAGISLESPAGVMVGRTGFSGVAVGAGVFFAGLEVGTAMALSEEAGGSSSEAVS